jgi:hypothetical protein
VACIHLQSEVTRDVRGSLLTKMPTFTHRTTLVHLNTRSFVSARCHLFWNAIVSNCSLGTSHLHQSFKYFCNFTVFATGEDSRFFPSYCLSCLLLLHHRHHHHVAIKELGHLLTRSGLAHPEVSSIVFLDSFHLFGCTYFVFFLALSKCTDLIYKQISNNTYVTFSKLV